MTGSAEPLAHSLVTATTDAFNLDSSMFGELRYLYCFIAIICVARIFTPLSSGNGTKASTTQDVTEEYADASYEKGTLAKAAGVKHIAVTMDGNRRFGQREHGNAIRGHWDGAEALQRFIKGCMDEGVEILTVYAFSTENWNRPEQEVNMLMGLITQYSDEVLRKAGEKGARIRILSSDTSRLPDDVRLSLQRLEADTAHNSAFHLNICISYGGRGDIAAAARTLAKDSVEGRIEPDSIGEESLNARLLTGEFPDPDILLRTSGELRLSNFLLWQCAYAELFFLEKLWPEVQEDDVRKLLLQHMSRRRRYGT